jgi:hypothetical protein
MPEYTGYVSNRGNNVDWLEAAQGLSGNIQKVDQAQKQRRAENEQLLSDTESFINQTEQPKSKTLGTLVLNGADMYRTKALDWNKQLKEGKISRTEYQSRMNKSREYWDSFANATKTFDQRLSTAMERQQVGADGTLPPASQIEAEMQAYFGGLSQLADKKIVVDDDGTILMGKYDQNGNLLSTEDVKHINNPGNIIFNRIDLNGIVSAGVKNWASWQQGRVTDPRLNPKFALEKTRLINAATASPRSSASILVDNTDGEYQVYFSDEEKQQKKDLLKQEAEASGIKMSDAEIESRLIKMRQDENGDYQPDLTESQFNKAKEITSNAIEMQLERTVTPPPASSGGGFDAGDYRDMEQEKQDNLRGYIASREMWTKGDPSGLRSGYTYTPKGSGDNFRIEVRKIGAPVEKKEYVTERDSLTGKPVKRLKTTKEDPVIKIVKNAEGLAEFAYNGDQNTNIRKYNEGRQTFHGQGLQSTERFQEKGSQKKSTISPEQFDAQWAKLKRGQTLTGPDGKTYTKQ